MTTTTPITTSKLIARARSVIGRTIHYKLGAGGIHPEADSPADAAGNCDCSGFVAWCLGISRYLKGVPWYDAQHNGEWLNTDAIVRDARSPFGFFEKIDKPEVGCLVVFGKQPGQVAGHVGIVSSVVAVGRVEPAILVVHCSAGNDRKFGSAIQETGREVFPPAVSLYARCAFVMADSVATDKIPT